MNPIHPDQVLTCLAKISGTPFEKFFMEFWSAIMDDFTPLGGMHDGGADGFQREVTLQSKKVGIFCQASTEADHRKKVRGTVKRLKEAGRDPKTLFYVTNRIIQYSDDEEYNLSNELSGMACTRFG